MKEISDLKLKVEVVEDFIALAKTKKVEEPEINETETEEELTNDEQSAETIY